MNLSNMALKLNNLFMMFGRNVCQSSLLEGGEVMSTVDLANFNGEIFLSIVMAIVNFILKLIYLVGTFVLNFIEFFYTVC